MGDIKTNFNPHVLVQGKYSHAPGTVDPIMLRHQYKQDPKYLDPNQSFVFPANRPSFLNETIICPLNKISCAIDRMMLEVCTSAPDPPVERENGTIRASPEVFNIPAFDDIKMNTGDDADDIEGIPRYYDTATRTYHMTNTNDAGTVITTRIDPMLRNVSIRSGAISGFVPNTAITILPVMFTPPNNDSTNTSYTNQYAGASITVNRGHWIRDPTRLLFIGVDILPNVAESDRVKILPSHTVTPRVPNAVTPPAVPPLLAAGTDLTRYQEIIFNDQRNFSSKMINIAAVPASGGNPAVPARTDIIHYHVAPNYVIKITRANLIGTTPAPTTVIQNEVNDSDITTALGVSTNVVIELIPRQIFQVSTSDPTPTMTNPAYASNSISDFSSGNFERQLDYSTTGFSRGRDNNDRELTATTDNFSDIMNFISTGVFEDGTYRYIYSIDFFLLRIRLNSNLLSLTENRLGANGMRNIMGGTNSNDIKAIPIVIRPGRTTSTLQPRGSALYAYFFGNRREVFPTHGEVLGVDHPTSSRHTFHSDINLSFSQDAHVALRIIEDKTHLRLEGHDFTRAGRGVHGYRYHLQRITNEINPTVEAIKEEFGITRLFSNSEEINPIHTETARIRFKLFRLETINENEIPQRILPLFTNPDFYINETFTVNNTSYPIRLHARGLINAPGSTARRIIKPARNSDFLRIAYPTRFGTDVRVLSIAFKLSENIFCISRMRESTRVDSTAVEMDGGHIGTGRLATLVVTNYNVRFDNAYAMLPESSVIDVYPFTLGGAPISTSRVIDNPNYPTGLDFVYSGTDVSTFTSTNFKHGNMIIADGSLPIPTSGPAVIAGSALEGQLALSTMLNGVTISGHRFVEQRINVYIRGPSYALSVGYNGYAIFDSSGTPSTSNSRNAAGFEHYRYRQEQFSGSNNFPNIYLGDIALIPSPTTSLPGGVTVTGPLAQIIPNDPNIRTDPDNPSLVYYLFPQMNPSVGVVQVTFSQNEAGENQERGVLLPYEVMSTAIENTNVSASGQPYQTCLVPLPDWFRQWGILFQNDYVRRTYPLEYKAFSWGFASEEEWKSISYGDMTMHPQDISIFHKEREQFRKMRLFHMERMFKKMHLTLMNVPPESFTCEFQLKNINEIWYGAQDITAPSSTGSTDIDFRPISPLLPTTTISGNINYSRPSGASSSLPTAQNPDPHYKILYAPQNVPDIIYFRIRVYGHEVTEMELKMKDDLHKDIQSKKFFVDTDPIIEEFYFNAGQDNINITLEAVLGPVAGLMFELTPELNYNPGNIMNRIGDAAPGIYYDDLRTLAQQTTFYIGREQSPYEIVTQPAPFIYLKTGLLQGQTPFIRDLEATYARYYQSVANAPDGFINHTTSNVTACVPIFTFSFCRDYLKGIKGFDNGSSMFKGDCSIQIQNTKELFRGIQKRLPSMPNFVPPKIDTTTLEPFNLNERIYSYITRGIKPLIRITFVSHVITLFEITPYNIKKEPLRY